VLRIFPPYLLGILVYLALSFALHSPGTPKLWLPYVFYYVSLYMHYPMPLLGPPCGVPVVVGFGLTVLWSLSVEEIYYTISAPVVRFTSERGLHCILVAMILAAPPLRWWLHTPDRDELFLFYCRMDCLAYGSAVALLIKHRHALPQKWLRTDKHFDRAVCILIPITAVFWRITGGYPGSRIASTFGLIFADVTFALFTFALIRHAGGNQLWVRIFRARWLRSIGKVSYSLYLFHYPLGVVSAEVVSKLHLSWPVNAVSVDLLGLALSFAVAYGLWYGMESRILRWKDRKVPSPAHAGA
jgi:peptidoglycan/LPS O-acetylase OafA/YrhL